MKAVETVGLEMLSLVVSQLDIFLFGVCGALTAYLIASAISKNL
jgi:hypothetical protein